MRARNYGEVVQVAVCMERKEAIAIVIMEDQVIAVIFPVS